MNALFITGTDTDVGKTIVTGCLARYFLEQGKTVITQKWIQTGAKDIYESDFYIHTKIMGKKISDFKQYQSWVIPYMFKTPCSPHLASIIEKRKIRKEKIIRSFKLLTAKLDFVIVEGIGGALVPFSNNGLVIDIVKDLGLPVLIVAANKLGAINHTLLTLEALGKRKIPVVGVIFNNINDAEQIILEDNPRIIEKLGKTRVLGCLSKEADVDKLYKQFLPIGKRVFQILSKRSNLPRRGASRRSRGQAGAKRYMLIK